MKWIVLWTVINMSLGACPSPGPYTDQFGRVHEQVTTTLMACYDRKESKQEKEFSSYEEALQFVNSGKENCKEDLFQSYCKDWKIEERKVIYEIKNNQ